MFSEKTRDIDREQRYTWRQRDREKLETLSRVKNTGETRNRNRDTEKEL